MRVVPTVDLSRYQVTIWHSVLLIFSRESMLLSANQSLLAL